MTAYHGISLEQRSQVMLTGLATLPSMTVCLGAVLKWQGVRRRSKHYMWVGLYIG